LLALAGAACAGAAPDGAGGLDEADEDAAPAPRAPRSLADAAVDPPAAREDALADPPSPPTADAAGAATPPDADGDLGDAAPSAYRTDGAPASPPPMVAELPFRSVGLGPFAACYLNTAHAVSCFGRPSGSSPAPGRDRPPADLPPAVALSGHHVGACAILKTPPAPDDAIRCWGQGFTARRPPRVADPVFLTSGDAHACALGASGAVTCWGASGHTPPAGLRAKRIASSTFDCAIAADDRVVCWGPGAPTPPAGLRARRIATGGHYEGRDLFACAVDLDDKVVCWGAGRGAAPPAGLIARDVAAAASAACALRADGTVACWGTISAPQGLETRALLMTYLTAAAVTPEGKLTFWGDLRDGKGTPPQTVIPF
jgi:hypothetical protein